MEPKGLMKLDRFDFLNHGYRQSIADGGMSKCFAPKPKKVIADDEVPC